MKFKTTERYQQIPPYLFARIDVMKQEAIAKGADIINLGIGDPDLPTPNISSIRCVKPHAIQNIISILRMKDF